ncbi:MAG: branched-chain amino acid ABC transporter permease [Halanaerobiales bacterium]|nr:branched-chain amino acid ABC transporter permease [Halanaerobiales bacterium]
MEFFIAQLLNGLSLGSIYVLLVTGFNLMLLVARIIQFAYPQFVVLSMYATWGVLRVTNSVILAVLVTIAVSIILNLLSEPIFRRITSTKGTDINATLVASLGISMIIVEVMSHSLNQGFPISFSDEWVGGSLFRLGIINIDRSTVLAWIGGILVVVAFFYLLYRTTTGRLFRAIAENRYVAKLVGIPIFKTSMFSYFIAGLLGGVIAILLSMLLGSASPWLGESVALKVLAVSIVAGLGNLKGGLFVGLALGIVESFAIGYVAGSWSNVIAFVLMLVVVLLKPSGLFGAAIE